MVAAGQVPVAGHATFTFMMPRACWYDVFHLCLLWRLLIAVQGAAAADVCKAHKDVCAQGWHSLLQLKMPVGRGSEPGYLQRTRIPEDSGSFPDFIGSLNGMPPSGPDPSLMVQTGASAHADTLAAGTLGMAEAPLQAAAQAADRAELLAAEDLAQAADAERSLKGFVQKGKEAQEAQEGAMAEEERAAEAVLGAMQRVQRAGQVEKQEVAMEAQASKFLQGAVESAEAMQAAEKQGGMQEVKAAQLIQEALKNLQVAGQDDPASATFRSLKAALQAQNAVAVAKSQKLQTAALLQESLRAAATAVQTLKSTKEVQTSDYLREAYRHLQAVQAAWDTRTLQEVNAAHSLQGMLNDSMSVQRVAEGVLANSSFRASLLQGLAQQVHAAQAGLNEEEMRTQSMREAFLAEQMASKADAKKSLDDAALRLEMSEASRRSEAAKAEQLSRYVQNAEQASIAAQTSSMQDAQMAQMSRYMQAQMAQLQQQLEQIKNAPPQLPPLGLPSNVLSQPFATAQAPPQLSSVGLPPLGLPSNGLPQVVQVAAMPSVDQRFPGLAAPIPGMPAAVAYGSSAPQFGRLATGAENTMPALGPLRVDDAFAGASFRR
mmetsp:Transcript_19962/g.36088  ORF Transcript_19962/g.36088 Transcript_19962/m.36088 type:complete len:603 (+) Transcript_19962:81-1889(+)